MVSTKKIVKEFIAVFKEKLGMMLEREFADIVPIDTGNLYRSITYDVRGNKIKIIMPEYAMYLEYGTGIFVESGMGPGQPIRPKKGKFMHWVDSYGKEHFAPYILGMQAQPFVRPTFHLRLERLVQMAVKQAGAEIGSRYGSN